MRYVYYASFYTESAMIPAGAPEREYWVQMAGFLEECLRVIEFAEDDRFELRRVGLEAFNMRDPTEIYFDCEGWEYDDDDNDDGFYEFVEEGRIGETGEDDLEGERSQIAEFVQATQDGRDIGGETREEIEDREVRETIQQHVSQGEGGDKRIYNDILMTFKARHLYGATFEWHDEQGKPTPSDIRDQLRQNVTHDLREIDTKHGGRLYKKPALGFR
ncbi:hypothetical protein BDV23DRAFT_181529 [Aspergillus alliaceus]|uniref:Uncharacterized protein n=1 Tax=Petromyces alliaceus TaxID=209559 RepID=A0A5N7CEP4_PETAA|nr:hypothetical protein BDV23DRAFT_181529 [Aspergillus alliaceus]